VDFGNGSDPALNGLADAVAAVYGEHLDTRADRAHAQLMEDVLTVVLAGGMTRADVVLHQREGPGLVTHAWQVLSEHVEEHLLAVVESRLLRGVRACLSACDPAAQVRAVLFVLEPIEPDLRSRSSALRGPGGRSNGRPGRGR
jgi:hypothetical protein